MRGRWILDFWPVIVAGHSMSTTVCAIASADIAADQSRAARPQRALSRPSCGSHNVELQGLQ